MKSQGDGSDKCHIKAKPRGRSWSSICLPLGSIVTCRPSFSILMMESLLVRCYLASVPEDDGSGECHVPEDSLASLDARACPPLGLMVTRDERLGGFRSACWEPCLLASIREDAVGVASAIASRRNFSCLHVPLMAVWWPSPTSLGYLGASRAATSMEWTCHRLGADIPSQGRSRRDFCFFVVCQSLP